MQPSPHLIWGFMTHSVYWVYLLHEPLRSSPGSGSTTTALQREMGSTKPWKNSLGHLQDQEGSQEKQCGMGAAAQLGLPDRRMKNRGLKNSPAAPHPDIPHHIQCTLKADDQGGAGAAALHLVLENPGHNPCRTATCGITRGRCCSAHTVGMWCLGDM